jgi:hypothetical protein
VSTPTSTSISALTLTPSIERQTGSPGFGAALARTVGDVARGGLGLLSALTPGGALLSAAVSGVASVASAAGSARSAAPVQLNTEQDVLNLLSQPGELSTQDYLRVQAFMQREAQTFTAVSNILKVRSDTAKAAINNIR